MSDILREKSSLKLVPFTYGFTTFLLVLLKIQEEKTGCPILLPTGTHSAGALPSAPCLPACLPAASSCPRLPPPPATPHAPAGPAPGTVPSSSQGTKEALPDTLAGHKGLAHLRPPHPKELQDASPTLPASTRGADAADRHAGGTKRSCPVALHPWPPCGQWPPRGQRPPGAPRASRRRTMTKSRASQEGGKSPERKERGAGQKGCPRALSHPGGNRGRPCGLPSS